MTPRHYQQEALDSILSAYESGLRRVLLQMPTGTGKTNVFLWLTQALQARGVVSSARPCVILAHREELLQQPYERIIAMEDLARVGIERAQQCAASGSEIIIASVQSVGRKNGRLADLTPGLVIVDEAHHAAAESYHIALRKWRVFEAEGPLLLGCTATPKRLDRQALHDHAEAVFQTIAYQYSLEQAIDDDWLSPVRGYRVRTRVDLDKVRTVAGDFVEKDLAAVLNTEERTQAAIDRWQEVAAGRKTIVFCVDVAHAEATAKQWQAQTGSQALCVSSRLDGETRLARTTLFRQTPGAVLTNVDIATEGFDVPDIGCIVMLRPTKSWTRYVQGVGRGLRLAEGKEDCIVLDVVDNTKKHSLVNIAALLDLPPKLDLQGRTLREAREKIKRLGECGYSAIAKAQPDTLSELDTLLEQVDMLAVIDTPEEIKAFAKFRWLPQGKGVYRLNAGAGRTAVLAQDLLGEWVLTATGVPERFRMVLLGDNAERAFRRAEKGLATLWEEMEVLALRDQGWMRARVSDKQRAFLRGKGVREEVLNSITRGEASGWIAQIKQQDLLSRAS